MNKNIHKQLVLRAFKDNQETVWCTLKASNVKGATYDPYRNTGYTKTNQSPLPVKAIVHSLTPDNIVLKQLGYNNFGSIEIIINNQDVNLIKICEKISYDEVDYSPYNKALGNRVQISKRPFGFYKVILFKIGN